MPSFENHHDLFNTTTEDFNTNGVKCINEDVWKTYMKTIPDSDGNCYCNICKVGANGKVPECLIGKITESEWVNDRGLEFNKLIKYREDNYTSKLGGCLMWAKLSRGPVHKNQYLIIQTKSIPGNPNTLRLRRAQLAYLYFNKISVIMRATQKRKTKNGNVGNGLVIHHKNEDPCDDRKGNNFMIEKHEFKHAFKRTIVSAYNLLQESDDSDPIIGMLINQIDKSLKLYNLFDDSPKVWKALLINERLINGKITQNQCHDMLAEIEMCEPRV